VKSDKNKPDDDEIALFRNAVREVRPLRHDRHTPTRRRPAPIPKQTLREQELVREAMLSDEFDPADIETGEELIYARPGVQHALLRKLRRGHFSIAHELDLHGMTVAVARREVLNFILQCQSGSMQCVRIIHGKGHGSRNKQPVLKVKLNGWLQQIDAILAFCSARPVDGGTGAVYVLLKKASG
jgi:DNA-nicking Smr family endonuclease